jgi:hypothetical protein
MSQDSNETQHGTSYFIFMAALVVLLIVILIAVRQI